MMTLEWRYRALVLRALAAILRNLLLIRHPQFEPQSDIIDDAHAMLDEFRRGAA